jgi:hypothetical protein
LGWDASGNSAVALLILSTGVFTFRSITIIHNSDSQGAILSLTEDGSVSLIVWNMFVYCGLYFVIEHNRERFDHLCTFSR